MSRRLATLLVAVLAGGLLAGGAVGVLVGASTVLKITACVPSSGLMRHTTGTTCRSGERKVQWNVVGPAGPKGTTGAQGPAGPQGPTGPAAAGSGGDSTMRIWAANGPQIGVQGALPATLAALSLPAGSYYLEAFTALPGSHAGGSGNGNCWLTTLPNGGTDSALTVRPTVGLPTVASVAVFAEFNAPTTTVYFRCGIDGSYSARASLTATAARLMN